MLSASNYLFVNIVCFLYIGSYISYADLMLTVTDLVFLK